MRKPRKLQEGVSYHIISRANRKELILSSPEIKEMLLQVIREAKIKYSFQIKNFCIMSNHLHLIFKPMNYKELSRIMQWILSVFAKRFNKHFHYQGHVWYDRFKSKIIKSYIQYVKTFIYIANNPVRAKIVKDVVSYEYNGISFLYKGILDILERPPNNFIKMVWKKIMNANAIEYSFLMNASDV